MNFEEIRKEAQVSLYRQGFKWLGNKVMQFSKKGGAVSNFGKALTDDRVVGRVARGRVAGAAVGAAGGAAAAPEGHGFAGAIAGGVGGSFGGGHLMKRGVLKNSVLKPGSVLSRFRTKNM